MLKRSQPNAVWAVVFVFVALWFVASGFFQHPADRALGKAIRRGDVEAARKAFQDGATMSMPSRGNNTFLHAAAHHGNVEIAKILVEHGALRTLDARDDDGNTALDIAIANNHHDMANYLRSLMTTNRIENAPVQ